MSKKTVLITGCSDGGLGAALCVAFHKANWRVLATARNIGKMSQLAALGIETLQLDVLSEESLRSCFETVTRLTNNKLDMIINNAGIAYMMPVTDIDIEETRKMFDLNFYAPIQTIKIFLPLLLANTSGATIVNHTSIAGDVFIPFGAPYNSTKAALAALTESLRWELAPFGIKVINMKTGAVKSNIQDNTAANHNWRLPPDSIFTPAKVDVERSTTGEKFKNDGIPADAWARGIVADLTKKSPPRAIWSGPQSTLVWLSTFLPAWLFTGPIKEASGMDKVEKIIAQHQKSKKRM
jgi:1-acylglycerone phosphate reductase